MRYPIVAVFLFLTLLHAEQIDKNIIVQDEEVIVHTEYEKMQNDKPAVELKGLQKDMPHKIAMKNYKLDSVRQQMLRRAKYLKKKYKSALVKFENWEMKKELLKKTFRQKNRKQDTAFGSGNAYGKERADKRRLEYYHSLDVQERHIQGRVDDAHMKLAEIKEEFLFKYAVPLTSAEMNGTGAPIIEDKSQKVQMLNEYINESSAWRKCWEKVDEFDRVSRVASSIEKLFPNSNLTRDAITNKMGKNKADMQAHVNRYQSIELEYQTKYGLAINSGERAKAILENINKY